jgi:hypothetical protein
VVLYAGTTVLIRSDSRHSRRETLDPEEGDSLRRAHSREPWRDRRSDLRELWRGVCG